MALGIRRRRRPGKARRRRCIVCVFMTSRRRAFPRWTLFCLPMDLWWPGLVTESSTSSLPNPMEEDPMSTRSCWTRRRRPFACRLVPPSPISIASPMASPILWHRKKWIAIVVSGGIPIRKPFYSLAPMKVRYPCIGSCTRARLRPCRPPFRRRRPPHNRITVLHKTITTAIAVAVAYWRPARIQVHRRLKIIDIPLPEK